MIEYELVRSRRKTIAIEVETSGRVTVRAPLRATAAEINGFVEQKKKWINEHLEKMRLRREAQAVNRAADAEPVEETVKRAMKIIPEKVRLYADVLKVDYGRITIRNQKTRWGSCSSKGNLNFHYALVRMPEDILEYVVVHELCHRIEMNHSVRFWTLVGSVLPDYAEKRVWLKNHGAEYR